MTNLDITRKWGYVRVATIRTETKAACILGSFSHEDTSPRCSDRNALNLLLPCQTGTVTFYTPGNSVKSVSAGLLPRSQQPFTGWLFDGTQRLAHVSPGRFMTFHLDPGAHTFTVPWHSTKPGKDQLLINVKGGGQVLRPALRNHDQLRIDSLGTAQQPDRRSSMSASAARSRPHEAHRNKRVDPSVRIELDPVTTFPSESLSQH